MLTHLENVELQHRNTTDIVIIPCVENTMHTLTHTPWLGDTYLKCGMMAKTMDYKMLTELQHGCWEIPHTMLSFHMLTNITNMLTYTLWNVDRYRDAGAEVITVLSEFGRCVVERASIDEAYVDMTQEVNARLVAMETGNITTDQLPNTFVVGWEAEDRGKTGSNSSESTLTV